MGLCAQTKCWNSSAHRNTELWKINFVQHWHLTSARQQLSFKNHAWEKPETTEKQTNRHWRGTEDTPTVCTEAKERHGTHKKQKHMCNHQAIPEILNWVESSKLERILGNLCIWFYLVKNHLSSKPPMEVSALWWELKRKKTFLSQGSQSALSKKSSMPQPRTLWRISLSLPITLISTGCGCVHFPFQTS